MVDEAARVHANTPSLHGTRAACQSGLNTSHARCRTCSPSSSCSHQHRSHGGYKAHAKREQHGISHPRCHTTHPAKPQAPGHTLQQHSRAHQSSIAVVGYEPPRHLYEPHGPTRTQHRAASGHTTHEHQMPHHTRALRNTLKLPHTMAHDTPKCCPAPKHTPHTSTLTLGPRAAHTHLAV